MIEGVQKKNDVEGDPGEEQRRFSDRTSFLMDRLASFNKSNGGQRQKVGEKTKDRLYCQQKLDAAEGDTFDFASMSGGRASQQPKCCRSVPARVRPLSTCTTVPHTKEDGSKGGATSEKKAEGSGV